MNIKIRKRLLAGVIVTSLLLTGCASGERKTHSYKDVGMDLIALMDEKAENAAYIEMASGSEQIKEYAAQFGEGDYSEAQAVYEIKLPIETYLGLTGIDMTDMSENLQTEMTNRMISSIGTLLNGNEGTLPLATSAILTSSTAFYGEKLEEPVIYLYQFGEQTYPALVVFVPAQDDIVMASSVFLANKEIGQIDIKEKMQALFDMIGGEDALREQLGADADITAIEIRKLDE